MKPAPFLAGDVRALLFSPRERWRGVAITRDIRGEGTRGHRTPRPRLWTPLGSRESRKSVSNMCGSSSDADLSVSACRDVSTSTVVSSHRTRASTDMRAMLHAVDSAACSPRRPSGATPSRRGPRAAARCAARRAPTRGSRRSTVARASKDDLLADLVRSLLDAGRTKVQKDFDELVVEPFSDPDPKPLQGLVPPLRSRTRTPSSSPSRWTACPSACTTKRAFPPALLRGGGGRERKRRRPGVHARRERLDVFVPAPASARRGGGERAHDRHRPPAVRPDIAPAAAAGQARVVPPRVQRGRRRRADFESDVRAGRRARGVARPLRGRARGAGRGFARPPGARRCSRSRPPCSSEACPRARTLMSGNERGLKKKKKKRRRAQAPPWTARFGSRGSASSSRKTGPD